MSPFAGVLLSGALLLTWLWLLWLQLENRTLRRALDEGDRRYLAQFSGEAREAEARLVNILRRARGMPPL